MAKKRSMRPSIPGKSSIEILKSRGIDIDPYSPGYQSKLLIIETARQIREARKNANLSQTELATNAGMTQADVSRIESGLGKKGPSIDTLQRLAIACGYTFSLKLSRLEPRREA